MSKGNKFDQGKVKQSLIPVEAIEGTARALGYGEGKYGTHNFRNGIQYTRLTDATSRHVNAFIKNIDLDDESGLHHIDHALANLAMLKFMIENRPEMDDRWKDQKDTNPVVKKETEWK